MKVDILYFSGTGNTKFIALEMADELRKNNCTVETHSFEDKFELATDSYDFLFIGFPKYFGYIPIFLLELIKQKVPNATKETKTFVFDTAGGPLKMGHYDLEKILIKKNHTVVMSKNIVMPNDYFLENRYKPQTAESIASISQAGAEKSRALVRDFLRCDFKKEHQSHFFYGMFRNFARKRTATLPQEVTKFSTDESCSGCGLCALRCPRQNITLDTDKPIFNENCVLCLRCLNTCPNNAILYDNQKLTQCRFHADLIETFKKDEMGKKP